MSSALIGVDLGGTNLRTALVGPDGTILEKQKEESRAQEGYRRVIDRLITRIRVILESARLSGHVVAAIGVGAPGVIQLAEGIVVKSPNFPDWDNLPLKREIEQAVQLPVFIENDANAAALGEQWQGAGKGIGSMIFLTLGTGVGGGIVLNGKVWHGADGMAGEIGHITIRPDGRRCGCGNNGCLEMYASARGIIRNYADTLAARGTRAADGLTAATVYAAANRGDAAAMEAMLNMGRDLGIGIACLANIFNPEMIVIGGGVMDAWPLFIETTRTEVRRRAFRVPAERAQLVRSRLGDDAGMVGAAAVAKQGAEDDLRGVR